MAETVISTQRGFLDFSPIKKDESNKENDVPVLSLIQFSKAPFVSFGSVKLGTSKSAILRIENPTEDAVADVTVDKIPSSKGFSVDQSRFTIQPEGSFNLTVTWTPTEEGGIRELIIFNANGVLKHQAVLLGRAEAPKKKKKSLWDTIKNKREGGISAAPRGKKTEPSLKIAANKTFQVSRKPQYKREKPRSPLASLNEGVAVRRSLSKHGPIEDQHEQSVEHLAFKPIQRQRSQTFLDPANVENLQDAHKNSPVVLLVPAVKLIDPGNTCTGLDSLVGKPDNRELARVLNRTLSPIGTPEKFKRLMPQIQPVESPAPVAAESDRVLPGTPVLSVRDALALIDSDLTHVNASPPDACSSYDFSDSLESKSGNQDCGPDKTTLRVFPDSPKESESSEPRLTFFVSKKPAVNQTIAPEIEVDNARLRVKKASFTSATVTKSKAPAAVESHEVNNSGGRKIKKSRRRLLEKTLELSDSSSQCESRPGTPCLPVIDPDTRSRGWQNSPATSSPCNNRQEDQELASFSLTPGRDGSPAPVTFPITCLPSTIPASFTFPITSPPPSVPALVTFSDTSPPLLSPSSHLPREIASNPNVPEPSVTSIPPQLVSAGQSGEDDLTFPVHLKTESNMGVRSKKRKSEEYLRNEEKSEVSEKTEQVKRSRVAAVRKEPARPVQEKRCVSWRQQPRPAGSVCSTTASSLKTTRSAVAAQAKQPNSQTSSRGAQSLRSSGARTVKTAKIVAVAQSKLTFIKPAKTAIPRHPMPFAAKNMFYDERWIEKQERGFTWWINYILTPDDFKVNTEVTKVNAVSLAMGGDSKFDVPKAPTKEELSFSTYTARRKLNRLRRSACQLFTSEAMVKAIQRLELEVEAKRLLVRKDRHLWKDIGERQKVLNWLLSYNPLWLRIGLETIYGELISLESNSDVLGLAMFILQRLLWNPDIAAEFKHAKVPHLYKDGHEEALSRFTLKKLLLLVCFLDKAKESRLIEHDPCLFCMDAEFKTSKDLLLAFSRDFLSGEGILPRHLGYLGLPVSHVQTPLDEFNFAVKNLAVDLKCGIRLVRVMELFIQDWSLSQKLRMPAISRLQKVHNVDIALQVLKTKGVDLTDEHGSVIDSRDIVDGHREKTLSLLWKIIFTFQVEVILDVEQLSEEIGFLTRTLRTKRKLASLRADRGLQQGTAKASVPYEHSSSKITLLMDWVNAVCDFYNLRAENFTVSFSDGRVLCYLIHHYHPSHLPEEAISHSTTQTVECSPRGRLQLNCSASDSDDSFDSVPAAQNGPESPSTKFKELLENEKNNFRLINSAVTFLGGVPAMITPADMSNTIPSEKVVMSYLSFLCARLLDLRNETRAARVIQGAWRKYKLKKNLQLYQERNVAAAKIQAVVSRFLQRKRTKRQNHAAVIIQSVWRSYTARNALRLKREAVLRALQHDAATVIQAQWRMYSAMRAYQCLRYHAIVVQAQWRMKRAASAYGRIHWAATVIQKYSRAWALTQREREQFLSLRMAVLKIQRAYRRWKAQKTEKENCAAKVIQAMFRKWYKEKLTRKTAAALKIQSWYRMHMCQCQYRKMKRSAALIQAQYRGHAQRCCFQVVKLQHHSAIVIQRVFRGHAARKKVVKMRRASVVIQRWFRASVKRDAERQMFLNMRCAAIRLQAVYRGHAVRELLTKQHRAAAVIQAAFRKLVARKRYLALKKATAIIQQKYRAKILAQRAKMEYTALRHAAVTLQAWFRGMRVRKALKRKNQAAIVIQSAVRMVLCRKQYLLRQSAAIIIQCRYRAFLEGKAQRHEYTELRQATIKIQAAYRGFRIRKDLKKRNNAATVIQALFRMHKVRMAYLATKCAAIIVQERYRAKRLRDQQMQRFRAMRAAAVVIQAAYRGHRVRLQVAEMHEAATVIQRRFLTMQDRKRFLALKGAVLLCQRRYRAVVLAREERLNYQHHSAVVIQRVFRGHAVRKKVAKMRWASVVIQRWFRASVKRDVERQKFLKMRCAAIRLQAAYRGHAVRELLTKQHRAAAVIQAAFRKLVARKRYLALKKATVIMQQKYRAKILAQRAKMDYTALRHAAVTIQALWRGRADRKRIEKLHQCATLIQAHYRRHKAQAGYRSRKAAAVVIQRHFRAYMAGKMRRTAYLQAKTAAVTLQAWFRGMRVRKALKRKNQAAVVIQSAFRMILSKKQYLRLQSAAVIIQSRYRAFLEGKAQRHEYTELRQATIKIQAAYRGFRIRKDLKKRNNAATVIQALFRMHKVRMAYLATKCAAIIVQERYRAKRLRDQQMQRFRAMRAAAVVIQAAYRGHRVRLQVAEMHEAATVIQRRFLTMQDRKRFLALKGAVLLCQRRYRAAVLAREERLNYQHHSAVVIQRVFRGHAVRKKVAKMRWASVVIQRWFRASVKRDVERQKFLKMRCAAISLQAAYRGHTVRELLTKQHRAAAVIQAAFRKLVARKRYLALKKATVIMQQKYRAKILAQRAKMDYTALRHAAVTLQAWFRGMRVRKALKKKNQAAIVIQSAVRMVLCKKQYLCLQSAAIIIQSRYRAFLEGKAQRHEYTELRQAMIKIQAAYRGFRIRKDLKKRNNAATVIQALFRMHKVRMAYLATKCAAIIVQERYRAKRLRDQQMQRFRAMRAAAVVIQAAYRGHRVRLQVAEMHEAATVIQRRFLTMQDRKRFLALKGAVLLCQHRYRAAVLAREERLNYLLKRRVAISLQAAYRGLEVRKQLRSECMAAITIQTHVRKYLQRKYYKRLCWAASILQARYRANKKMQEEMQALNAKRDAAVVLQAAFRGMKTRQSVNLRHRAATAIQTAYRAHREHKRYLSLKSSVLAVQRRYRATVAAKQEKQQYHQMHRAAIALQAAYRGQQVRKHLARRHQAAIVIQAVFRKHREEIKFQAMRLATVVIQRYYRACLLQRQDRDKFLKIKRSVIVLQAAFRGWCTRRDIAQQTQAATLIQSCWRCSVRRHAFQRQREIVVMLQRRVRAVQIGRTERDSYTLMRQAAITLQAHCRGWITRRQTQEAAKAKRRLRFSAAVLHHLSAIRIQRAVRAYWTLQSAKKQIHSVISIQRWVRARQQRRRYLEERRKVVMTQRVVRRWLAHRHKAASVIQHATRRFLLLRRQKRVQQGIVKVQALWRGHRSRRLNDNPKVVNVRHRLREVSAGARDEDRLCNKTSSALDYLLRYKHFSCILEALKNLETATRLSPECCERLVESGATLVIFTLIRCCNRSVPCMDVITYSIQILLNLSKYHKTIDSVYAVENSVETLLDLLQRYREKAGDKVAEKGGSIFTKACFLLALLVQDQHRALEVRKLPKALDRIRSIYRLTARKHKMDAERTVIKQKMNASINGSFLVQATPRKSRPAPKFAPDWVLRKDKLKDIVDPLRAIQMVADTLSIVL